MTQVRRTFRNPFARERPNWKALIRMTQAGLLLSSRGILEGVVARREATFLEEENNCRHHLHTRTGMSDLCSEDQFSLNTISWFSERGAYRAGIKT